MQDTSQGFLELKSNAWNKFQEAFPIGQGVWILSHVVFHVISQKLMQKWLILSK